MPSLLNPHLPHNLTLTCAHAWREALSHVPSLDVMCAFNGMWPCSLTFKCARMACSRSWGCAELAADNAMPPHLNMSQSPTNSNNCIDIRGKGISEKVGVSLPQHEQMACSMFRGCGKSALEDNAMPPHLNVSEHGVQQVPGLRVLPHLDV